MAKIIEKTTLIDIIVLVGAVFLLLQMQSLSAEVGVSPSYIEFYRALALIVVLMMTTSIVISFLNNKGLVPEWVSLGFIWSENASIRPLALSRTVIRFVPHIVFIIVISMLLLTNIVSIFVPVPQVSTGIAMSAGKTIYLQSVIPGVLEDYAYLIVLPMVIFFFMGVILYRLLGIRPTIAVNTVLIIIACLMASLGYSIWVIPGFTSSHTKVYGELSPAYLSAFAFSFGQSLVYHVTGIFFPLAHIIHNFIISIGPTWSIFGLQVGGGYVPINATMSLLIWAPMLLTTFYMWYIRKEVILDGKMVSKSS